MKNIKRELEWERELNVECNIVEDHTQQDASNRAKETKAGKTILFFLFFPCCKDVLWLKSFNEEEEATEKRYMPYINSYTDSVIVHEYNGFIYCANKREALKMIVLQTF